MRHATTSAYREGCRCEPCRGAKREYEAGRRAKRGRPAKQMDYATLWLSEMWRPVREYHQTDAERAAAWGRQQAVNESVENVAVASAEWKSA